MNEENKRYREYMKSDEWKAIARKRMEIDNYTCQGCGSTGTMLNSLEIHHLSYRHLYEEQDWIYEDLVCVCRSCHKNLHRIMERQTNAAGRRGWRDSPRIPTVHVFSLDGSELMIKEDNTDDI